MKLVKIEKGGKTAMSHAQAILDSFNKGGVFRHLNEGMNATIHRKICVEAILTLHKMGVDEQRIKENLASRVYSLGNTSSWNQLLNDNLQWEDEDGTKLTFKQRFGEDAPTAEIDAI